VIVEVTTEGAPVLIVTGVVLVNVMEVPEQGTGIGGATEQPVILIPSIKAPVAPTLESEARRHLNTIGCPFAAAGRFTVVRT
jgi:hypothetical protein